MAGRKDQPEPHVGASGATFTAAPPVEVAMTHTRLVPTAACTGTPKPERQERDDEDPAAHAEERAKRPGRESARR